MSIVLIPITQREDGEQAVSGRELHAFLGLGRDYTTWFKKMVEYGFAEGQDFTPVRVESSGGRPSIDHALTLDMAKELSMIQRTDRGKQAREYFIEVEKSARRAPAELSRADLARMVLAAESEKAALEAKVEADAPKVAYVDRFVADSDLRVLRNVAKSLGLKESQLRDALLEHNWIYSESAERWSEKKQEKETVTRYSAYASHARFFEPVPNHTAPRFRGEVMHTLKITPAGAEAIARACERWGLVAGRDPRLDMEATS